jgi:hypothetical protein
MVIDEVATPGGRNGSGRRTPLSGVSNRADALVIWELLPQGLLGIGVGDGGGVAVGLGGVGLGGVGVDVGAGAGGGG